MARIKVRFDVGRNQTGVPLDKLGEIASASEKFLRSLAADLNIETKKGQWIAVNFQSGSVLYDVQFADESSEVVADKYSHALAAIAAYDPMKLDDLGAVSEATLLEYAGIGRVLDPNEAIGIGIFNHELDEPTEWRELSYARATEIKKEIEAPILSYGMVQGILHAWYKGAVPSYFQLRELSTESLVKCIYAPPYHADVHAATEDRGAVILVTGHMSFDRATKSTTELRVEDIQVVRPLSDDEFEKFFGCAPNLTGELSTNEYIELIRGDGD